NRQGQTFVVIQGESGVFAGLSRAIARAAAVELGVGGPAAVPRKDSRPSRPPFSAQEALTLLARTNGNARWPSEPRRRPWTYGCPARSPGHSLCPVASLWPRTARSPTACPARSRG